MKTVAQRFPKIAEYKSLSFFEAGQTIHNDRYGLCIVAQLYTGLPCIVNLNTGRVDLFKDDQEKFKLIQAEVRYEEGSL